MHTQHFEDRAARVLASARRRHCGMRASAAALIALLAPAEPALAAEVPWTKNLAGIFSSGPVYTGALVWDRSDPGVALLLSDSNRPSLVLTSMTGTGPALVGSQAIYGVAVQGKGTPGVMPDGPPLSVASTASMATNQRAIPVTNPPAGWSGTVETFGALSVRSVGVSTPSGWSGAGGAVWVSQTGGTLSVGVPDSGAGIIRGARLWTPYASAIDAASVGGAGNQPGASCQLMGDRDGKPGPSVYGPGPNPMDGRCQIGQDHLGDSGNGGAVSVTVGSATQLVLNTSGPKPATYQARTPGVDRYTGPYADVINSSELVDHKSPVMLAGVTALSQGGTNGWTGHCAFGRCAYFYGNSGYGQQVTVDFAGRVTATGSGAGVTASFGIVAASLGGELQCPNHSCSNSSEGSATPNYSPLQVSQKPGGGGPVNVTLRSTGSIALNTGNALGILAVSAAGGAQLKTDTLSVYDNLPSGGAVAVTTESGSSIGVGTAQSVMAIGIGAVSTGNASMIRPFATPNEVQKYYDSPITQTWSDAGGYTYHYGDEYKELRVQSLASGGPVTVNNAAAIATQGSLSIGIAAMSVGGAAVLQRLDHFGNKSQIGSSGGLHHGEVSVVNTGRITTLGDYSAGLLALSASAGGIAQVAAAAFTDCDARSTQGACSDFKSGFSLGGNGSDAAGGAVTVTHTGSIQTGQADGSGKYAMGILAQSIGGGGGSAFDGPVFVGGTGGTGGKGGAVKVALQGGQVSTQGLGSIGVLAQSVGGGGGTGGNTSGLFFALGGRGGSGGDSGAVDVLLNGASGIEAHGNFAQGVVAQSVGGGGGTGGFSFAAGAFLSGGVGGTGGTGGSGGNVNFTSDGSSNFTTTGEAGHGLVLQSIGGGGGVGGAAVSVAVGALFSASLAVGGSGGTGGKGGNVTATLNGGGQIQTQGSDSPAVIAQSVGGGGGIAGSAVSASFAAAIPKFPTVSLAVAVGGEGGSGNTAGAVTVARGASGIASGSITTYGEKSEGIKAQSIGGGGGSGGDSKAISGSVPSGGTLTVTPAIGIGGRGGAGGLGGNVTVSNYGSSNAVVGIATFADRSSGILAQSVGGGGGDGGIGSASGYNLSGSKMTVQVDIGVGGGGGSGNHGGAVTVASAATGIQTLGAEAHGIHAQSIGGGGGVAGGGGAYGFGNTVSANVSVGGSGGASGNGGVVDVSHAGNISTGSQNQVADSAGQVMDITTGGGASGIFAQSIGGGGGQGGSADSSSAVGWAGITGNSLEIAEKIAKRVETGKGFVLPVTFNANISVGGRGGAAGNGAAVSVVNSGTVRTAGESAFGVHAQSIGGGGGVGGAVEAHAATLANEVASFTEVAFTGVVAVGGGGGAAGNGGAVSVTHSGGLTTLGHGATGIFGQSIGGGGGYGALNTAATEGTFAIGVSKNGNGGLGGSGGKMTVTNNTGSSVLTLGEDAPGILLQSIGGGGGAGKGGCEHSEHAEEKESASLSGSKCLGSTKVTAGQGEAVWTPTSRLVLAFGGGIGLSGNGGDVNQQLDGSVETRGNRSIGVVVQSIGGGAAYMTASASTLESTMVSPNAGQNSARGGNITITQSATGRITTSGDGAWGILAQSIGSGGGLAGDTSLDLVAPPRSNTLANLCCKAPQTMGADGGSITITNAGSITTTGRNAHGIVAQSIGGGGGISGGAEQNADATLKMGNSWQMYSAADRSLLKQSVHASEASETARNMDVSGEAEAKTSESLTFSAPVQSGMGSAVTIRNAGKIETTGAGSIGILAQSSGQKEYMAQIQVEVQTGGSVKGGSGANAAAIMVLGGNAANNGFAAGKTGDALYNATHNTVKVMSGASVTTVGGVNGMAILARDGLTDVINHGTITGSIDLGSTPGDFKNYGTFNAGPVVVVAKGTLENYGTMVVGGAGTTVISGGLMQDSGGKMLVQVLGTGTAAASPVVSLAGAANLGGTVQVQVNGNGLLPGAWNLLAAEQLGFTGQVASAYVFDWKAAVSGQTLTASPQANFRPQGAALEQSHGSLADYLARAFAAGESSLATTFYRMYKAGGEQDYKTLLESAVGRSLHQHSSMALQGLPVVMNQAIDCPLLETQGVKLEEGNCLWLKWTPSSGDQGTGANRTPFKSNLVSFGGQRQLQPGWWLAGSLGTISGKAESSRFSSRGDTMFGSIGVRHTKGAWTFAQLLSVGRGEYDNTRTFALPQVEGTAPSDPVTLSNRSALTLVALKSRVAYQRPLLESLYVKPSLDLDVVFTRHPGFSEQPVAQALWLSVHPGSDTMTALTPALEAGLLHRLSDGGMLHLYGSGNWRWSPHAERLLRMRIGSVSADNGGFEVTDVLPSLTRTFTLGMAMRKLGRYDVALELQRSHNERADTFRKTVWVKWEF